MAAGDQDKTVITRFLERLFYARGDATKPDGLAALGALLGEEPERVRVFYMATSPDLYGPTCQNLQAAGLVSEKSRGRAGEADRA